MKTKIIGRNNKNRDNKNDSKNHEEREKSRNWGGKGVPCLPCNQIGFELQAHIRSTWSDRLLAGQ